VRYGYDIHRAANQVRELNGGDPRPVRNGNDEERQEDAPKAGHSSHDIEAE
jgi:hypothetical protein